MFGGRCPSEVAGESGWDSLELEIVILEDVCDDVLRLESPLI